MQKPQKQTATRFFIAISGILLLAYSSFRAYELSFTCDESYTFLTFVNTDFWLPDHYNAMSANNHLLNTWLMKICAVFSESEWSLRLPNLLAHVLFLVFSAKLVLRFQAPLFACCAFLLVNLNPYLLDFFAAARGYGLSVGLMMGSLYWVHAYFSKSRQFKHMVFSLVFASLAVLANFTLLNYYIALFGLLVLADLIGATRNKGKRIVLLALIPTALAIFIVPLLLKLKAGGSFAVQTFGQTKGYWADTVNSLVVKTAYESAHASLLVPLLKYMVVFTLMTAAFVVFKTIWSYLSVALNKPGIAKMDDLPFSEKEKQTLQKTAATKNAFVVFLSLVLVLCFIAAWLQYHILGTKYSIGRTAVYLIPLFMLLLVFLLEMIARNKKLAFIPVLFALGFGLHFFQTMNFGFFMEYKADKDIKNMMALLPESRKNHFPNHKKIALGTHDQSERTINYYRVVQEMDWLLPAAEDDFFNSQKDFYYVPNYLFERLTVDSSQIISKSAAYTFLVNTRKDRSEKKFYVAKKNCALEPIKENEAAQNHRLNCGINSNSPFSSGFNFTVTDSLLNWHENILISLKAMVYAEKPESKTQVVITLLNNEEAYLWKSKDLYYELVPKKWTPVSYSLLLPAEAKPGDLIKTYLWNPSEPVLFYDSLEFKISAFPF